FATCSTCPPSPTSSSSRPSIPALHPKTTTRRRTPASPKPLTSRLDRTSVQASPGPTTPESRTRGRRLPWVVPLALENCR
ncbi:hypothetical protein BC827DRAFT_1196205, partial [Russula dissimulans]